MTNDLYGIARKVRWRDGYSWDTHTFQHKGRTFEATAIPDDHSSPPWEEQEGLGALRVAHRNYMRHVRKAPGELVLSDGCDGVMTYDFADACKRALADGVGFIPGKLAFADAVHAPEPHLTRVAFVDGPFPREVTACFDPDNPFGPDGINAAISEVYAYYREKWTPRQLATLAAWSDFFYLKAWCDNGWSYMVLKVHEIGADGEVIGDGTDYLGCVESFATPDDVRDYLEGMAETVAAENNKAATQPRVELPNGCIIAPRHPRANTAFEGEFMVAEAAVWDALDASLDHRFEDARDSTGPGLGGFCVVGDDQTMLVMEASMLDDPCGASGGRKPAGSEEGANQ